MNEDKENKKANIENEIENTENFVTTEETVESPENGKGVNKRLRNAILRMAAALILAAILLAITGFAPIMLLKGPKESEAIQNNEIGDFVVRDIYCILGFYADEKNKADELTGRYAVVPMNGELVSVHFTKRYLESADAVCDNTYDLINGKAKALDKYVVVEGTVGKIGENASSLMYDWFGINKDQLVEMRMIAETDDYSDYLSDHLLVVDTVNSYSETLVYITGIIAAMLLLYSIVEIVLMSTGFYLPKPVKEQYIESTDGEVDNEGNAKDDAVEGSDGEDKASQQETEANKSEDDKREDKE